MFIMPDTHLVRLTPIGLHLFHLQTT